MSSTKYAQPLRLKPKPSRILIGLLTVGHLGAIAVLLPLDFPLIVKLLIAVVLLVSLVVAWRKQPGKVGEGGVQTLTWKADGDWLLETVDGESLNATLHESTYVHPWLVVLNFRQEGKHGLLSFVLAPDALDRELFRELRVRLKVAGNAEK
jgi:toxin CptA